VIGPGSRITRVAASIDRALHPTLQEKRMAASSTMLELGTDLPAFTLPDTTTQKVVSSDELRGSVSVVAFLCNHCPYVKHIQRGFSDFAREYATRGVKLVAISSNDVASHPEDGPAKMAEEASAAGYTFPYLYDESQEAALAFRAACTPELYVFDREGRLAYRGRFDESTVRNGLPVTGKDARAALDALLVGGSPSRDQKPSMGCGIKWKPANLPNF
jgi:peroxiredoxin